MSAKVLWAQPQSGPLSHQPTHSKKAACLAHCPTAPWIVDKADVAFCGAVDFQDPNGAKALLEGFPHICPESIAHCQADCMCLVLLPLQGHANAGDKEVTSGVPRYHFCGELSWVLTWEVMEGHKPRGNTWGSYLRVVTWNLYLEIICRGCLGMEELPGGFTWR